MPIQVQPRTTQSDRRRSLGAIFRDEEELELRQSQDPPGHLRLQALRVGDSPRGPLKQTGESPLKTHDKPKLSAPHLNT
jgi:hypothetical protein